MLQLCMLYAGASVVLCTVQCTSRCGRCEVHHDRAIASMWLCRVGMAYILGQGLGLGVIGVWIAMTMDWVVRAFLFTNRIRTGKWLKYKDRLVK